MEARQKFSLRLIVKTVSTPSPSQHQGQTLTEEVWRDLWEVQQWPSYPNTGWNTYQTGVSHRHTGLGNQVSSLYELSVVPMQICNNAFWSDTSQEDHKSKHVSKHACVLATSTTRPSFHPERHSQSKYLVEGVKGDPATCKPWYLTFDKMRICIPLFGQIQFGQSVAHNSCKVWWSCGLGSPIKCHKITLQNRSVKKWLWMECLRSQKLPCVHKIIV